MKKLTANQSPVDPSKIHRLVEKLMPGYANGSLGLADVRRISEALPNVRHLPNYNPAGDARLLEAHCLSAAALDQTGKYEEARSLTDGWSSSIQSEVMTFVRKKRTPGTVAASVVFPEHSLQKAWFLKQAGIAEYRTSRFDTARACVRDSLDLFQLLAERSGSRSSGEHLTALIMSADCCYWMGCIETYASRFTDAEHCFSEGLERLARVFAEKKEKGNLHQDWETFAKYTAGRVLLGQGLLRFHMGSPEARSSLLAAKTLLYANSEDTPRQLRAEMLLLSVRRTELAGGSEQPKQQDELRSIIDRAEKLAEKLRPLHDRYFCRAMWTIGRACLDLADCFRRPYDQPGPKSAETERNAALNRALSIATDLQSQAYVSINDRLHLEILKMRTLRRLNDPLQAIDLGMSIVDRPESRGHLLLYTEALFALGHAFYDQWKRNGGDTNLFSAKRFIQQAGEAGEDNPRAQAVCCLHLARIAKALDLHSEAEAELNKWERLSQVVRLQWIVNFAERVKSEISSKDAFIVPLTDLPQNDTYTFLDRRLREFLVHRFIPNEDDDMTAAAGKLGISRQTLYNWKKEFKTKDKVAKD